MKRHVEVLDVLRGIAIFGMFAVNMTADARWSDLFTGISPWSAHFVALAGVNFLANGKFITIFSFLFGIGFYVQSQRQIEAGASVTSFWIRRLLGLLMIGLLANALTLPAWILVDYALFGLGLLLCYRLPPRWIFTAAIACFAVSVFRGIIYPVFWPSPDPGALPASSVLAVIHETADQVWREGRFLDISGWTIVHMWEELTDWRYYAADLDILGLMLLGLFVGRLGAVWDSSVRIVLARTVAPWLLGVGLLGTTGWLAMTGFGLGDEASIQHPLLSQLLFWPVGAPCLGLGYAAAIVLLMQQERWRAWLSAFAPVGRMALTNYLFTGFVGAFVSLQWGLGLYGEIFPAVGLLIVVLLLPLQIGASRWWLRHYVLGPFEWIWRCWTYGRRLPIRRAHVQESIPVRPDLS